MRNSSHVKKSLNAAEARLEKLRAQLVISQEHENLTVGEVYKVAVGRADTADVVDGVFLGTKEQDNLVRYVFRVGEGVHERVVATQFNRVKLSTADGEEIPTVEVVKGRIAKAEQTVIDLDVELDEVETAEDLPVGTKVLVQLGRLETRREVPAEVLVSHSGRYAVIAEDTLMVVGTASIQLADAK